MMSSEVNEGQSFDLSLVWTYFHCNSAVFSFHLIFNMPIFKCLSIFQFEVSKWRSKSLTYDLRSKEVMDTKTMSDSENIDQNTES